MGININNLWENNCLICLQESDYKMISIRENDSDDLNPQIVDKVMKCTNFKISELENRTLYPNNICKRCYCDLNIAYKFITLSEHSKKKLENFYKKLKKQANEESLKGNETDLCKKCSESDIPKTEIDLDTENLIIFEEHITSDIDNDNDDGYIDEVKSEQYEDIQKTKRTDIQNIFEESKKKVLERLNKEKFQKSICDLCGNYYSQNQLKYHRMRHDKIKRFECEICQRRFATETDLRRHMRVHTGEKPYACQYCERRFSDYGSRIKHERCHTGERPYVCQTCNKSFMYSHALKKHQSVHTGYKAFTCEICSTGFTKKEYLQNHMKKHNTEEVQSSMNIILQESIAESTDDRNYYFEFDKNSEDMNSKLRIKTEN